MSLGLTSRTWPRWIRQRFWHSSLFRVERYSTLKVVRRRTRSRRTSDGFALWWSMMDSFPQVYRNGSFHHPARYPSGPDPFLRSGTLRGHLRLTAATSLLKVSVFADNEKEIDNTAFENIAYVVQVRRFRSDHPRPAKSNSIYDRRISISRSVKRFC